MAGWMVGESGNKANSAWAGLSLAKSIWMEVDLLSRSAEAPANKLNWVEVITGFGWKKFEFKKKKSVTKMLAKQNFWVKKLCLEIFNVKKC